MLVEPARVDCLVKWQEASGFIAATEPRKLFAPVRSRSKHTSNGSPLISAQMASPLTRSVPAGCVAYCGNPLPPKRITPPTEPSAVDTALSGRPFKASKREEVSDNKAARFIGAHVSRDCRRRHRKTRDGEQRTNCLRHIIALLFSAEREAIIALATRFHDQPAAGVDDPFGPLRPVR